MSGSFSQLFCRRGNLFIAHHIFLLVIHVMNVNFYMNAELGYFKKMKSFCLLDSTILFGISAESNSGRLKEAVRILK